MLRTAILICFVFTSLLIGCADTNSIEVQSDQSWTTVQDDYFHSVYSSLPTEIGQEFQEIVEKFASSESVRQCNGYETSTFIRTLWFSPHVDFLWCRVTDLATLSVKTFGPEGRFKQLSAPPSKLMIERTDAFTDLISTASLRPKQECLSDDREYGTYFVFEYFDGVEYYHTFVRLEPGMENCNVWDTWRTWIIEKSDIRTNPPEK